MKSRARRVTTGAAVLVTVLLAVLAVANWATVRDHFEVWHFQITRETWTIEPEQGLKVIEGAKWVPGAGMNAPALFGLIATNSGIPVVYDLLISPEHFQYRPQYPDLTAQSAIARLESSGYRILEQRFPRSAYFVIPATFKKRRESLYQRVGWGRIESGWRPQGFTERDG